MSDYSSLKATINANVKTNNNQEITGSIMNSVLNAMVDSLGAGYQFMGVATPTNPGTAQTPDYKCFYIATTPGAYTNLGGLVVADGEVAILKYDTSWTKELTGAATSDQVSQLGQEIGNPTIIPNDFSYGGYNANNHTVINPSQTINRLMRLDLNNIGVLDLELGVQSGYYAVGFFDAEDNWLWREGLGDGTKKRFVITQDMFPSGASYCYLYNRLEITTNPSVIITKSENIKSRLLSLETEKAEKTELIPFEEQLFQPTKTTQYDCVVGSSLNKTQFATANAMALKGGKEYAMQIETDASIDDYGRTFELYAFDNNGTLLERFYITKFGKTKKTFSADVSKIGIYANINFIKSSGVVTIRADITESVIFRLNEIEPNNICVQNNAVDYDPLVYNLFEKKNASPAPIVLGWISDIHADSIALNRFREFCFKYGVDTLLSSGDNQNAFYTDSYQWWYDNGGHDIMIEIGNHDAWINSDSEPSIIDYQETSSGQPVNLWIVKQEKCFEKYFGQVASWGVTYSNGKCYYYKDFKDASNNSVLRLIVLDSLHYRKGADLVDDVSTQEEWLKSVLTDARQNNIPVVLSSHYWPGYVNKIDCSYNDLNTGGTDYFLGAPSVVNDFINNGGEFIAWLLGHSHFDAIGTLDGYPNQLAIILTTARYDRNLSSTARIKDTKTQDSFNIISFDTLNKQIKMVKVGADHNRKCESKRIILYQYLEHDGNQQGLVFCN